MVADGADCGGATYSHRSSPLSTRKAVEVVTCADQSAWSLGVAEEFDFTDDAVSTGVLPLAPRAMANSVLCDPERKGVFQSLDGRVQGVRHVRMGSVHTRQTRPTTRATSNGLIVGVMLTTPRVIATYRDVVHGTTAGRGDAIGPRLMQGPKDHIDDALGSLDIATSHGARKRAIDHTTGVGDDFNGSHAP